MLFAVKKVIYYVLFLGIACARSDYFLEFRSNSFPFSEKKC